MKAGSIPRDAIPTVTVREGAAGATSFRSSHRLRNVGAMLRRTLALLLLAAAALAACASTPRLRRVQIVHTNDLHGHVERCAAVAAVAAEARAQHTATLLLDAGDCISGTPVSTVFKGRPIFEIMSAMGYDAVALGNHEWDHGWQLIAEFQEISAFPLLCANARDPEGRPIGDAPYRIFETGGVRIGVIGLVTEGVPGLTVTSASEGCTFESPVETAKRLVPQVRAQCDVVVLLTHVGVAEDAALAGAVPGVDLIIGGHTHTELREPLSVEGVAIVQAKCYGERVGIIDLTWDTEKRTVAGLEYRLVEIDADKMPNDPRVKELVDTWQAQVEKLVAVVIGKTSRRLDKRRLRTRIERVYKDVLGTDFGFQNTGGIRATIEAGEIEIRDVWTVLPFDNTLVVVELPGSSLYAYAKRQLGKSWDPEKTYTVATNSFVADHMDKYFGVESATVRDSGRLMRDEVVNWVREHGGFDPAGRPVGDDGRGLDPDEKR